MQAGVTRATRRRFLKTATALVAAPYIITSSALGSAERRPASDRITTALIGSGGRGQQIIEGGDQVLAVCDVDTAHGQAAMEKIRAKAGNKDCVAYRDYREVLARDDIDAVVVATPDHWHVLMAMAAIKAGKAVYVEKPLTWSIREGRLLADVVRRYNAILQVGSQQRSDEKFIRACELVRNGRIGQLRKISIEILTRGGSASAPWKPQPVPPQLDYEMWLGPAPFAPYHRDRCHYNFRFVSDYSGGDVTNWGAHHLDIAQWALGADDSGPQEIDGSGKRNPTGLHDTFYDIRVDFTYANGVKVELRSGGEDSRFEGFVRFEGTEGWIYVDRSRLDASPKSILTSPLGATDLRLGPSRPGTHMGIWLDCVRARDAKGVNVPAEIGHRSATVCHLANIAMELRRKLTWDPAGERFVNDEEANRLAARAPREPWRY